MKLSTSLVAVKKITSEFERTNFQEDRLEQVAKLILQAEGVITPIIVSRTSTESYQLVDGNFEYYAAVKAREIDPKKGEMINAFILEGEKEEALLKQVKLLRDPKVKASDITNQPSSSDNIQIRLANTESRVTSMDSRLANLELQLEKRTVALKVEQEQEINSIKEHLVLIKSSNSEKIKPLEAINTLNLAELSSRLKKAGVNKPIAEKIYNARVQKKFNSFTNIVERVKGLGDKTMLKIIDSFYAD